MSSRAFARALGFVAIAASLLAAGVIPAAAGTWDAPVVLPTGDSGSAAGVVRLGDGTLVVGYSDTEAGTIGILRSLDGGVSWGDRLVLSARSNFGPQVSGRGDAVDVVWVRAGRVRYARSLDGGATFQPRLTLSPSGRFTRDPDVARGPGGLVAVLWQDNGNGDFVVRVSTNGGASFGPSTTLGRSLGSPSVVGVGKGVVLVAFEVGGKLLARRSLNGGSSWSASQVVARKVAFGGIGLAMAGKVAWIGYATPYQTWYLRARYRGSTDKGASWSTPGFLADPSWYTASPQLDLRGGVLRATFDRCFQDNELCLGWRVYVRESANGVDWSPAERVSPAGEFEAYGEGVAATGDSLVVSYTTYETGHVRRRAD